MERAKHPSSLPTPPARGWRSLASTTTSQGRSRGSLREPRGACSGASPANSEARSCPCELKSGPRLSCRTAPERLLLRECGTDESRTTRGSKCCLWRTARILRPRPGATSGGRLTLSCPTHPTDAQQTIRAASSSTATFAIRSHAKARADLEQVLRKALLRCRENARDRFGAGATSRSSSVSV